MWYPGRKFLQNPYNKFKLFPSGEGNKEQIKRADNCNILDMNVVSEAVRVMVRVGACKPTTYLSLVVAPVE